MALYQIRHVLFILLVYQSLEPSTSGRITIKNNGYRDIKVFLPSEVSAVNKTALVNAVKDLFSSASVALYIATKRRAYFAGVTFVVPSLWGPKKEWLTDSSNVSQSRLDFYDEVDVEISSEMDGSKPLTLHTGGCGEQAARIYLPLQFLLSGEDMQSKSRELVHYWAEYRYGIFPEGGFQSDSRYPLYYSIPGTDKVDITACTNIPLNYTMRNSDGTSCEAQVNAKTGRPEEGSQCLYAPEDENLPLKSSLMYQQNLVQMSQFCHGETELEKLHNVAAPSKHNALCGEESTWFVILRNQDFLKGRNQATKYRPLPTEFKYVQQSSLRVVVALETSEHMNVNSRYSLVRNALTKLILYDLPSGTKFGLVSYSDEEIPLDSLFTLEAKESRQNFLESVPFEEAAGPHFNRCATCAVEAGIQLLENDEEPGEGGMIILITTESCENSLSEDVKEKMLIKGIKIFVVFFSQDQNSNCSWETFSSQTGGLVHHITESVSGNMIMTFIYLTFASIVKGFTIPSLTEVLLAQEILPHETDVSLPFQVDNAMDKELKIFISGPTFDAQNSPLVVDATSVRCGIDEVFAEFERQHLMPAWVFNITSHQGPNCTFETKRKEDVSDPLLIMVTQKWQAEEKPITVHATLNHKNQTIKPTGQMPLKINVDVRAGINPITGADVLVTAYHPDGETSEILLIDDGVGDPDVTLNDGIYSTYFTNYSTEGHYSLVFKISSRDTTKKLKVDAANCCGSFMPSKSIEEVDEFTRLVGPISFFLYEKPLAEDTFPPNQILDVQVTDVDSELRNYTLQWTSAGDDYNQGMASSYQLKVFADRTELRYNFENTGLEVDLKRDVLRHTPPAEYGKRQEFVVRLPTVLDTSTYYLGIRAVDDAGNYGPVSNTVPVFLRSEVKEKTKSCDPVPDGSTDNGIRYDASICVIFNFVLLLYLLQH